MAPADDDKAKDGAAAQPDDPQQLSSTLTPTFMQAITNLRVAAQSLKGVNAALAPLSTAPDKALGDTGQNERPAVDANAVLPPEHSGSHRLLDISGTVEAELLQPVPRAIRRTSQADHAHFTVLLAVPLLAGLGCLAMFGFTLFTGSSNHAMVWLIAGIAALCLAALFNPALHCQCAWQKSLLRQGGAAPGQIDKKRTVTRAGKRLYFLDYAFNAVGSVGSSGGCMQVSDRQYDSVAEGDVMTVVYISSEDGQESFLYRFSAFQAIL